MSHLHRHHRFRIPRGQRIHIRQRHIAGAVCAEGGFVFAADDGEGVEDVFGVLLRQATVNIAVHQSPLARSSILLNIQRR